nr:immunoglobulin light chain junction region [Macaca mulatta]MOX34498.1 immunoglobulin light chain junction region [Macaca mulatta]MOX34584.1 immunoglobulin light chain junction region [Macaca mulatta]MOX36736.1 immunoglobulin light chain junction region [Macaca mulatta]MOX37059.1 immunoglobulin light chain junction region [Macaca mulatta]
DYFCATGHSSGNYIF